MNLLEKAISIAIKAHEGQVDKAGKEYILHPLRVMLKMSGRDEMIVAILHDVAEDTNITLSQLKKYGFSNKIINALGCVTKKDQEVYDNFINRIKKNKLAIKIKIADLQDNLDLKRIPNPKKKDFERIKKYKKALKILNNS
jgi:(p)ppGpp synthase/HD superfamily hydrolase